MILLPCGQKLAEASLVIHYRQLKEDVTQIKLNWIGLERLEQNVNGTESVNAVQLKSTGQSVG